MISNVDKRDDGLHAIFIVSSILIMKKTSARPVSLVVLCHFVRPSFRRGLGCLKKLREMSHSFVDTVYTGTLGIPAEVATVDSVEQGNHFPVTIACSSLSGVFACLSCCSFACCWVIRRIILKVSLSEAFTVSLSRLDSLNIRFLRLRSKD